MTSGYWHPEAFGNHNYSRATIYYEVHGDTIKYAIAYCSPKDTFVKKTGRKIAFDRFQNGDYFTARYPRRAAMLAIESDIFRRQKSPNWFKGLYW